MLYSVLKYIEVEYPNSVFDEVKYASGTGQINLTFDQQGIRGVLFHFIYFNPQNAANVFPINFFDQFGQIIFATQNTIGVPNWAPIPLVRRGNILKIVCSHVQMVFQVSYQLIMNKDFPHPAK